MNFLFLYNALYTGGIETLILRMSDWLIKEGHSVDLILQKAEGELLADINPKVNLITLGKHPSLDFIKKYYTNKFKRNYDVIYSFSPSTTWMGLLINNKNSAIVLNGVYHLYDYLLFADKYKRWIFDKKLPDVNKVFMTPKVHETHEYILKRKIINPIIWPLPIDTKKYENIERKPIKYKLVSIGRLETFKTYNFTLLEVVKNLRQLNYDVSYYIYGEGIMHNLLIEKIKELQLQNHVFLKGLVPYEKFPEVLRDAFAFIGMGTSAIEAGLCQVPSITAIAYANEPITHGLIHQLINYNSGEFNEKENVYNIQDILMKLFEMNHKEYYSLCSESAKILKEQYDIDKLMNYFVNDICSGQRKIKNKLCPPLIYLTFSLLKKLASIAYHFLKNSIFHKKDITIN